MGWADRIVHRHFIRGLALYAGLIGIAWCALFPIIWALSGSLKADGEVTEPTLFPSHPQWSNYREVFALMPFWRMFFNTVLYAGCVTAGQSSSARWPVMPSRDCSSGAAIRCSSCT